MKRQSLRVICGCSLLLGIAIGVTVDVWWLSNRVEADALDVHTVQRLYDELGSGRSALVESGHTLSKIASLTTPSVVHIQSERRTNRRVVEETGSGVIMSSPNSGGSFILTNRHVVAYARPADVSIHLNDGRVIQPNKILADESSDVAILRVSASDLQPARWGNSDDVEIGHLVLAMGSPFGLSSSMTLGIISAKGRSSLRLGDSSRSVLNQDFLQTDAAINPGNSGGPLIDMQGRIIGINTAIASNSGGNEGIGFSIPINLVRQIVDQLLENGRVERAYLGVKLNPEFDAETASTLQLGRVRGAHIVEVYDNTPASRALLKHNDVVLSFDGVEIFDENHLINLVSLTPIGNTVRLVVFRNGKRINIDVVLGNRATLERRSEVPAYLPEREFPVVPMGLTLHTIDNDLANQLGVRDSESGLLVVAVDPHGVFGDTLKPSDIIQEIAGSVVQTRAELNEQLQKFATHNSVMLKIGRPENGMLHSRLVIWHPDHQRDGEADFSS